MADEMSDEMRDVSMLLAVAAHRNGGMLTIGRDEVEECMELYGEPAPLLMGRDETGLFAAIFKLDRLVEDGWPIIQRQLDCSEAMAKARARTILASMREAQVVVHELQRLAQRDAAAKNN